MSGATGAISIKAINKQNTWLFTRKTTLSFRVFCYGTHLPQFVVSLPFLPRKYCASTHFQIRNEVACLYALNHIFSFLSSYPIWCALFHVLLKSVNFFSKVCHFNLFCLFTYSTSPTLNLGFKSSCTPSSIRAVKIDDFGSGWACKIGICFVATLLFNGFCSVYFWRVERGNKRRFSFHYRRNGFFSREKNYITAPKK